MNASLSCPQSGFGESSGGVDLHALLCHRMTIFCLFMSSLIVSASVTEMLDDNLLEGQLSMLYTNIAIVMISWIPILSHFSKGDARHLNEAVCPTCSVCRTPIIARDSTTERIGLDDPRLPASLIACVKEMSAQYFEIARTIVVERITRADGQVTYLLTLRYPPESYLLDGGMLEFVQKMGHVNAHKASFTPTTIEPLPHQERSPFLHTI